MKLLVGGPPMDAPMRDSPPSPAAPTGMLAAYFGLMEVVTWKVRASVDQYGDPNFSDSQIYVIWYDDVRLIKNERSEELQQFAYIQTTAAVQQGDAILRGGYTWPVIGIQKTPTFEGEQFRIANLGQRMI